MAGAAFRSMMSTPGRSSELASLKKKHQQEVEQVCAPIPACSRERRTFVTTDALAHTPLLSSTRNRTRQLEEQLEAAQKATADANAACHEAIAERDEQTAAADQVRLRRLA